VTGQIVLWALFTGGITGAVWVAIVMFGRQKRIESERRGLDEVNERLDDLDAAEQRVAELEERLDFAERLLAQKPSEPLERK
jgi:hypothetical protein